MRAGQLDQRVTLQSRGSGVNAFGEPNGSWSTVATVWGAVQPLLGREFLEGRQAEGELTTRIRIRYRTDVTPTMRAVHGAVTYDIVSVMSPDTDRRETILMCREVS